MEGAFLLDVVVAQGTSVFKLFSGEDKTLLIWWNSLFILDLGFHVLNGIAWFNLKGNSFSCEGLDEDLHTTTQTEYKMESAFLLDIVVAQGTSVFKLFSGEDKTLLIWGNSLFILDLGFHVLNSVTWLDLKCNGFSCESLHKNLHLV